MSHEKQSSRDDERVELLAPRRAPAGFDYAGIEPAAVKFLKVQADRIRRSLGRSAVQIGRDLAMARQCLSHGEFIRWVETVVGIPARTAQGYMRIAKWAERRSRAVGQLPLSLLYLLSTRTTPKEVVEDVIARADAGVVVSTREVRAQLNAVRQRQNGPGPDLRGRLTVVSDAPRDDDGAAWRRDQVPGRLSEAMNVIAAALLPAQFVRFSDILTSRCVLEDPAFAAHLKAAFERVDKRRIRACG